MERHTGLPGGGLRILDDRKLKWRLPEDSIAQEVLIPGLRCADRFDCMVGFFSSHALRQLAPGLASFIGRDDSPMRLLVSPLLTEEDVTAITTGHTLSPETIYHAIGTTLTDEATLTDALVNHTLECLAYLLSCGRLKIKIVLVTGGIFHVKEWILHSGSDIATLSGSANFTARAFTANIESLHLHRSWRDLDNLDTCIESVSEFELLWKDHKPNARAIEFPTAIRERLIETYRRERPPTEADFLRASELPVPLERTTNKERSAFVIPPHLKIYHGPYAHQGRAVKAWEDNRRRGILAMATGSGKTVSALVAAKGFHEQNAALLLVIAVPTTPLLTQWQLECEDFGLRPLVAPKLLKPERLRRVQHALNNLQLGVTDIEVIITTNTGLVEREFDELIATFGGTTMLIADEVHNLGGSTEFRSKPPVWTDARLGLSATPVRQYDDDGTRQIIQYFGDVVFEFSLEDAIDTCLVPYDYILHKVNLTDEEADKYVELSARVARIIAQNGGALDPDDARLTQLLIRRRMLLETASAKVQTLEALLDRYPTDTLRRTLFYATDKDPCQLQAINEVLKARRIRAHQITATETSHGRLMTDTLRAFEDGVLHALTAKRVLDEGINVPQIDTAFLLASTTIRKQWIQRRGRVLRPSPNTGKTHATIHDFVVLPPNGAPSDLDSFRIVEGELARCEEFASIARNRAAPGGPYSVINEIRYEYLV